jgi:hypothetical protein
LLTNTFEMVLRIDNDLKEMHLGMRIVIRWFEFWITCNSFKLL